MRKRAINVNINEPVKNPELLKVMQELAEDSSKQTQFVNELHQAKFLCPVQMDIGNSQPDRNGEITLGTGTKISILSLQNSEGEHFLMAFTDWMELGKWKQNKNQQTLILTYEEYQYLVLQEDSVYVGVAINPYGDNLVLNRESILTLSKQDMKGELAQPEEPVMIGVPADYPTEMVEKLQTVFSEIASVHSAYLLWMARNQEMSYLLVIDTLESPHKLFSQIGNICKPYLNGKLLDIIPFSTQFGKNATANQKPFYNI